jgi:acetylornithine deacetylase
VKGIAGHAARNEGVNAIYLALEDIQNIQNHSFARVSDLLGPVKTTVTVFNAGKQHNVIPDVCDYVIDCRVNECYTLEEVLAELKSIVQAELTPRSFRLNSSKMEDSHPMVQASIELGIPLFGSPTLSDQALLSVPSVKIGPGHSGRSHTADEFIFLDELKQGIQTYQKLLLQVNK